MALIEITIFSVILSFVLVLVTKFVTDQKAIKDIKDKTAALKKMVKEAQKKGNQGEVKHYSDLMFKVSRNQFKYSMRSMIVSLVVVAIALGWLNQTYHGTTFDMAPESDSSLAVKSILGTFNYGGPEAKLRVFEDSKWVIDLNGNGDLSDETIHNPGDFVEFSGLVWGISSISENSATFTLFPAKVPFKMPFLGNYLTWFWLYLIITIPTSLIFRKLLNVH